MSRKMPNFENIADFERQWDEAPKNHSKSYEIKVVTPMVGGGVEAGENDKDMLIRPTSIRGHLRFWWRATRGKEFDSVEKMRERENEIWGSTETPSRVQIKVKIIQKGKSQPCAKFENGNFPKFTSNHPGYVLFPFQGKKENGVVTQQPKPGVRDVVFDACCKFPEHLRLEIESAFWAWTNFGGIGARTRRGCGALFCKDFAPPSVEKLGEWFKVSLKKYKISASPGPKAWPTIGDTLIYGKQTNEDHMISWNTAIKPLRDFRQGEGLGRNSGTEPNRPGRSYWPEPDTIRSITNRYKSEHKAPFPGPDVIKAFPRAEFGLPMIIHFKDASDPHDTVIAPTQGERMGSPLILKPLIIQDKKSIPLAFLLMTEPLAETFLMLMHNQRDPETVPVKDTKAIYYNNSPMKGRTETGSAIEAFIHYLTKECGFTAIPKLQEESR